MNPNDINPDDLDSILAQLNGQSSSQSVSPSNQVLEQNNQEVLDSSRGFNFGNQSSDDGVVTNINDLFNDTSIKDEDNSGFSTTNNGLAPSSTTTNTVNTYVPQEVSTQQNATGASMGTTGYVIYCSRCGSPMKSNSRYCMKCGNLNTDHPENQNFNKFIKKKHKRGFIDEGIGPDINVNEVNGAQEIIGIAKYPAGFNICFFLNIGIYVVLSLVILLYYFFTNDQDMVLFMSSGVGYKLIYITVIFFYLFAWEIIFMKMNKPWWSSLIPIYNFYLVAELLYKKDRIYRTITLIPGIGQIFSIYLLYRMGECFNISGKSMVLLAPIKIPSVAYGGYLFNKTKYVSNTDSFEKEFTKKKFYFGTCLFFFVFSLVSMFLTTFTQLGDGISKYDEFLLNKVAEKVMRDTELKVKAGRYKCQRESNEFYIYYSDVPSELNMILGRFHPNIGAIVRVTYNPSTLDYEFYISVSDGTFGFPEVNSKNLSIDLIKEYGGAVIDFENWNFCELYKR